MVFNKIYKESFLVSFSLCLTVCVYFSYTSNDLVHFVRFFLYANVCLSFVSLIEYYLLAHVKLKLNIVHSNKNNIFRNKNFIFAHAKEKISFVFGSTIR